jgi:hypothetical protein
MLASNRSTKRDIVELELVEKTGFAFRRARCYNDDYDTTGIGNE